ncbi:MAG: hypothetical protein JNM17_22975 [Archangium sp.]|nr:hypothetical protein [Archangium sp.]
MITEVARLARLVSEVEDQVSRELEDERSEDESTPLVAMFDALARRDREGIPFGIPSTADFQSLTASLEDFVERTAAKAKPKRRRAPSKRSQSFDPFDLTVALALLEEDGVTRVQAKQLAAAEVVVTGKPKTNVDTASAACRKWEHLLSKARDDVPTVRGWFEERRNTPAK